jgi:hypothetical protein
MYVLGKQTFWDPLGTHCFSLQQFLKIAGHRIFIIFMSQYRKLLWVLYAICATWEVKYGRIYKTEFVKSEYKYKRSACWRTEKNGDTFLIYSIHNGENINGRWKCIQCTIKNCKELSVHTPPPPTHTCTSTRTNTHTRRLEEIKNGLHNLVNNFCA